MAVRAPVEFACVGIDYLTVEQSIKMMGSACAQMLASESS
jgi:hypothetical protein